jgi:hypothetical protein
MIIKTYLSGQTVVIVVISKLLANVPFVHNLKNIDPYISENFKIIQICNDIEEIYRLASKK